MKKVSVTIDGIEYQIVGDREEAEIVKVAKYIDTKLKDIKENAPSLSKADAAILTSINIADELFHEEVIKEELENKIESLKKGYDSTTEGVEKEFDSVLLKLEEAEKNASEFEKEVSRLKKLVEEKERENESLKEVSARNAASKVKTVDEDSEKKIKSLEMKLKEMEKKVAVAESMATEFQNKAYNLQLNYEELKNNK